MFDRVGQIVYPAKAGSVDAVLEAAIEAGADDVAERRRRPRRHLRLLRLGEVAKTLEQALGEAETVKAVWQPQTTTALDEDKAATMVKLIGALDDDDDVQAVYSNFEVSDEVHGEADGVASACALPPRHGDGAGGSAGSSARMVSMFCRVQLVGMPRG